MAFRDQLATQHLFQKSAILLTSQSTMYFALASADMSTVTAANNALPTECTGNGLDSTSGVAVVITSTVTTTGDACEASVTFTSATSGTIYGQAVMSTDSTTTFDMFSFYCYAASIPIESGDTLTCTHTHQYEVGV